MEPDFERGHDFDQEREYLARREQRRKRWMQEKRRRQKRRRLTMLLLGLGAVCLVTVSCLKAAGKKTASETEGEKLAAGQDLQMAETEGKFPETPETLETQPPETEKETDLSPPLEYRFASTADTQKITSDDVISAHAILVNAEAGTVVAEKGAYDRISPASMTKVMTVLVASEMIPEEKREDTFSVTQEITDYAYANDCSSVGFQVEETVTVKDLFYGAILPSGADAALGLAVYAAGSQETFVDRMNEKAQELGISASTHFTNCVGLYDEQHYCTVYDMAVIMSAAMQDKWCREVLSAHTYTTSATPEHPDGIEISNWFLRRIEDKETGGTVVGGKTGYVVQSGNCAVSYEEADSQTPYICVTANSTSSWRCIYDHVEIYNRYIPADS